MIQEFCQNEGHDSEELLYVCNELKCIDLISNKLICQKCLCVHNGVSYKKLKEKAFKNYNQYIEMLQNDIDENETLKKSIEESLKELQGKIMKMLSNFQKNIFTFVDQQNQRLQTNKSQAQSLMQDQNPSLDSYIFFAKFSDKKAKQKQETTKQQIKAIVTDLIDDLTKKIEYLKQPDVNEYKIIEFELQSFEIKSILKKQLPYSYCEEHCSNNTSICINTKCLEQNNLDYHCLRCSKTSHVEDFKNNYLVEYDKLKKDQKIMQNFVVNKKQCIKEYAQKLANNLINQIRIEQKEQQSKYEIAIENIKSIHQQFEINLSVQDNKYVFGNLILQFITTKKAKMVKQKFLEQCGFLQQKQDQILKLQICQKELKEVIDQIDQMIKSYSSENMLNLILREIQEIRKDKNEIQYLQNENQSLIQIIDNLQGQINSLILKNKSQENASDNLLTNIDNLKQNNQSQQVTIKDIQIEIDNLKQNISSQQVTIKEKQIEIDNLKQNNSSQQVTIKDKQIEIDNLKQNITSSISDYKGQIDRN
ncbi:unnamed protein product [Paramecium sonneborni]|uniref:Uncharacterized protein n=1 Tax=Paramecium sonneborni TaxID=65129 RepID=A0A8S1RT94_9CILI|nr:unnamed protein product [Paramecium sonneborni]